MQEGLNKSALLPVIIIVGPTAIGKTSLAIKLAKEIKAEIISADSRQIFKGLDIGTAKPTMDEREQINHHFIDYILPAESFSAGAFGKAARTIIEKLRNENKNVVVAGGSGLYIQALLYGMVSFEKTDDKIRGQLKSRLKNEGLKNLYLELKEIDPELAVRLSENDTQRILRGLEVFQMCGEKLSAIQKNEEVRAAFPYVQIGLSGNRQKLYDEINKRVEQMFQAGLVDEVKKLIAAGYGETNALNAVGYKEIVQLLNGKIDKDRAIELIQRNSRRYAKRQFTWFRKDENIKWFDLPDHEIIKKIISEVLSTPDLFCY